MAKILAFLCMAKIESLKHCRFASLRSLFLSIGQMLTLGFLHTFSNLNGQNWYLTLTESSQTIKKGIKIQFGQSNFQISKIKKDQPLEILKASSDVCTRFIPTNMNCSSVTVVTLSFYRIHSKRSCFISPLSLLLSLVLIQRKINELRQFQR